MIRTWMLAAPGQWPAVDSPPLEEQVLVEMHSPKGLLVLMEQTPLGSVDDGLVLGLGLGFEDGA